MVHLHCRKAPDSSHIHDTADSDDASSQDDNSEVEDCCSEQYGMCVNYHTLIRVIKYIIVIVLRYFRLLAFDNPNLTTPHHQQNLRSSLMMKLSSTWRFLIIHPTVTTWMRGMFDGDIDRIVSTRPTAPTPHMHAHRIALDACIPPTTPTPHMHAHPVGLRPPVCADCFGVDVKLV